MGSTPKNLAINSSYNTTNDYPTFSANSSTMQLPDLKGTEVKLDTIKHTGQEVQFR